MTGLILLTFCLAVEPVFTGAQAAAGKAAYLSSCVRCHTETLVGHDGTGEISEFLRPYKGKIPPLAGSNAAYPAFLSKWGPQSTQDLAIRILDASRGFPPPGRKVDEQLSLELAAYILQINGAQSGTQPLTSRTAVEIRKITARTE